MSVPVHQFRAAFPPAPPTATTCPKCEAPAQYGSATQTCAKCGLVFVLRAGALVDHTITPVRDEGGKELKSKSAGLIMAEQTLLTLDSIGAGTLDPIVGRFAVDSKSVRFEHLYSVAAWRALNVAQLVALVIITAPMGLLGLVVTGATLLKGEPGGLLCTLPFVLIAAYHAYSVLIARTTRLRVIGFKDRTLELTVTGRRSKQREFVDTLFRRAGLAPVEVP